MQNHIGHQMNHITHHVIYLEWIKRYRQFRVCETISQQQTLLHFSTGPQRQRLQHLQLHSLWEPHLNPPLPPNHTPSHHHQNAPRGIEAFWILLTLRVQLVNSQHWLRPGLPPNYAKRKGNVVCKMWGNFGVHELCQHCEYWWHGALFI